MVRPKLDLSPEERKIHDRQMHYKQVQKRRERARRMAYREWVRVIIRVIGELGWDKVDLLMDDDCEAMDAVVDELMNDNRFKITLGSKIGLKIKKGD